VDLQSLKIDRGPPPTASHRRTNPWPFRVLLLAALCVAIWLFWPALSGFVDRVRLPEVNTMVVSESAAAAAAAVRGTAANGYVVAARRAALSSDVPGRIVELSVREGSVVKQGDVVARLFADEYRAALKRAEADLAAAAAGVQRSERAEATSRAVLAEAEAATVTAAAQRDEAKANVAWAKNEHQRAEELLRTGVGSPRDVERARTDLDAATARLAASEAAFAAQHRSDDGEAAHPRRDRRPRGQQGPAGRRGGGRARGQGAARQDRPARAVRRHRRAQGRRGRRGRLAERAGRQQRARRGLHDGRLRLARDPGQRARDDARLGESRATADVFLDAFPDDRYEGVVDRIWPTADRQKATVEVRVRLLQRNERLRPKWAFASCFARPMHDAPETTPVLRAQSSSRAGVGQQSGKTGAFVLERDTVRFQVVTAGERKSGRVAIAAGLLPGQCIVLESTVVAAGRQPRAPHPEIATSLSTPQPPPRHGHSIEVHKATKTYHRGGETLVVLDALDLSMDGGAFYALMGPSGSGKTTLLNLIGGLDHADAGTWSSAART
jgi:HlyD family secretion protein